MYTCNKCGLVSDDKTLFVPRYDRDPDAVRAACKECHRSYSREYLRKNRAGRRKTVDDLKAKPCMDCGIQYPPYVMEFDHRGDKEFSIGHSLKDYGMPKILAEATKCDVVCANCHRERTHSNWLNKRFGGYRGAHPEAPQG